MSKEIFISSTPHETRLAIVENDDLTEIYYERENEYTLAGSIYNGKVTRVLPGMQSSFVDIGLERDAFLYITDFMEEAGDSADFDSADGQRPARSEGRRDDRNQDRNQDRSRNRDADRPALPAPEAASFGSEEARAPRSPESDSEGRDRERGGRGGRSRRGGRDRNRERQPGTLPTEPFTPAPTQAEFDTPFHSDEATLPVTPREDAGEIGEGAPGADGSRRWRGRRGRRSRRPGQRDDLAPQTPESAAPEQPLDASPDSFEDEGFEFDAAAAPLSTETPEAPTERADAGFRGTRDDRSSRNRGGRDRGDRRDRNDRGDRSDRGPRNDRDARSPRAPRGFAPRTALYGVDNTPAYGQPSDDIAPPSEPIILPGESLSKYRSPAEQPAATAAAPISTPRPSTEFTLPAAWDGGITLPGESLSRHRRQETRQPAPQSAPQSTPTTAVQSAAPVSTPIPAPIPTPPAEYEPTEASASYRVDPAPPSEFRQSAPPVAIAEPEAPETPEAPVENLAHTITPAPEQPTAQLHTQSAPQTEAVPAHDLTAVTPAGEMLSAPPATAEPGVDAPFDWQTTSPAAPIAHETAVLQQQNEQQNVFGAPAITAEPHPAIEHEVAGDEDFTTTLHASSIEEMDDLDEEETLEGAADLGTMLREMSIDEITRPKVAPELEDIDEMEEEDSLDEENLEEFDMEGEDEEEDLEHESDTEEDVLHEDVSPEFAATEIPATDGFDSAPRHDSPRDPQRDSDRRRGRRDGRRDGRREGRSDSRREGRSRSAGGAGDRERSGGRSSRHSMQATNLPAISDLLKPGQEVLVQIAKEPIAKKGARITSHIALPGRFLVFMPTVNHTGVSRKIESDAERRRLKDILLSEKGEASGGFIVRTAAASASEEELRSDLRFLLNLWADIKQRSESSKSPALIYHDLNLVERILRDQVTDTFSAIWVDTETEYERVLRFLQRFQPSLIRRVKLYSKDTPLFEQFGITEEINKALRSKVWLKSGGSIVINQTEALVAIDINTGKYVGKTARLEDTIVKTNLDAIPEIVRQIRLRDLGGIIIIDFIDMDERKNRNRVMAALEEELKNDRAPSKILQFNDFGLVAITRKRVKQSLERTLSTTCGVCQGTGMVKSPVTVCNDIYIEMRKMHKHLDRGDIMLRVHPDVVKQLKSSTKWLQEMEEMVGKTILVKSDPSLHPEQFDIH